METLFLFILLALLTPLIYSFFSKSNHKNNKNKKLLPPELAGKLPIIGHLHLLDGSQPPHLTIAKMAEKMGPIFTIQVGVHKTLIISSWELAKECFTVNDKVFSNRPTALFLDVISYNYAMFGATPYGEYWRQIRKIVSVELLSNNRLELLKHVREKEINEAIKVLYRASMADSKKVVEMKKWFWDINLNVILKMVVGKRYEEYKNGEKGIDNEEGRKEWRYALSEFFELAGKFPVSDALPFLRWLDIGGIEKKLKKIIKLLDCVMIKWLEEHKEKRASSHGKIVEEDFMDVLISILDEENEISDRDSDTVNKATCLAIILAASDTTRTSMTWTLSLLLNHRHILKKVQEELDFHVGKERQVMESDLKNLTYFQAVIKETFRFYPAAALSVPRVSVEDCIVGGYHIPAGTRLFVHISNIHRDPRIWSNPLEFIPERFITTHKDIDVRGQNFELIPFGAGRRICPGTSFALLLSNLTLATLLHSFEIDTPSGGPVDMTEGTGITTLKATPLEIVLTPRLPAHLY